MKITFKTARRIALGILCLLLLIIAKGAGVFIDLFILILYGMTLGGIWAWKHIYLGGLDRIAKKNAEAIVEAQRKANEK